MFLISSFTGFTLFELILCFTVASMDAHHTFIDWVPVDVYRVLQLNDPVEFFPDRIRHIIAKIMKCWFSLKPKDFVDLTNFRILKSPALLLRHKMPHAPFWLFQDTPCASGCTA